MRVHQSPVRRSIECLVLGSGPGRVYQESQSAHAGHTPVPPPLQCGDTIWWHDFLLSVFVFFRGRYENRLLAERDDADRDWPLSGRARFHLVS